MSIVSWELSDISVAKYGLDLKLPVWRAFKKIDDVYYIEGLTALYDGFAKNADGNTVRNYFLRAYILTRDVIRGSQGDEAAAKLFTDTYGYDIKSDIYTALKGLVIPDMSISRYALDVSNGITHVIAGNDASMFLCEKMFILEPDICGISFEGTQEGVGVLNPETNKYEFTMKVWNEFYPDDILTQTIQTDNKLGYNSLLDKYEQARFFTNDAITSMINPGLICIEVSDYQGKIYSSGSIKSSVYKFGMTPAEGVMPTTSSDYIYITDTNYAETLSYKGDYTSIRMSRTFDGQPLKTVGSTTFGYSDVVKVKIPEGVETIE